MSISGSPRGSSVPPSRASSRAADLGREHAGQRDPVALGAEAQAPGARDVGQLADQADHRRRVDRAVAPLVVERDVAADDGDPQRPAGVAEPAHALRQLPGDVRLLRVAEVQAVGQPERLGADAGEVGGAFEHRLDRAAVGVRGDAAAVAVDRDRDPGHELPPAPAAPARRRRRRPAGARCATARSSRTAQTAAGGRRCWASRAAPAAPRRDPPRRSCAAASDRAAASAAAGRAHTPGTRRPAPRPASRRPAARRRYTRTSPLSVTSPIVAARGLPVRADRQHRVERVRLDHAEHPLLGLRDHDLERLHAALAQRHARDVDVDPDLSLARHLASRRGQAGRAEILQRDEQAALEQIERALHQLLLRERVADLHARSLGLVALAELRRGEHRGAADPVAPGRGAEQHEQVSGPGRGRADQPLGRDQPDAHRVDQAVLLVGGLEVELAADRRHADRVAVVADPRDRAVEQVARALAGRLAEAQRVEDRDRPRADREDVAQDPPDAGRRALERLDGARMVVRLDLERDREPAADVDRAGVLTRPEHQPRALRRQRSQQRLGVLVGAVLRPQAG